MSALKIFLSTLSIIFLAELGDKTQLTVMTISAQTKAPVPVFLGAATGLALSSLLGVIFGAAITRVIPEQYIHAGAGLAFIVIGVLLVMGKL
ncbi:MAG: TMEM165/GDT1 family protein [Bacillota bacterium]